MIEFAFQSRIAQVGRIDPVVDREVIHAEPMLFSASLAFAREAGGPLTRLFLSALEAELEGAIAYCHATKTHLVVDTRSHMLMPGFTPAIGGWHCDAYPRRDAVSQPDLSAGNPEHFHYVAFVSDQPDGVSRTEFIQSGYVVDARHIDPDHVWASVSREVHNGHPKMIQVDGQILKFWQATLHRAAPAYAKGWRWWARISVYPRAPQNSIRKQVQVYVPEGASW